ncbi:hypothetical protein [Mucilaginibacter sp.]
MEKIPEITSSDDIKNKLNELQKNYDSVNLLLGLLGSLKTKLSLDLSPKCTELGKYADFMMDCRDNILNRKIKDLVKLLSALKTMMDVINPANSTTNKDFNNQILNNK